jgi:hypothetical protein
MTINMPFNPTRTPVEYQLHQIRRKKREEKTSRKQHKIENKYKKIAALVKCEAKE